MSSRGKATKMKILLPVDASRYAAAAVQTVRERPWPAGTIVRVLSAVENIGLEEAEGSVNQLQQQRIKEANQLTKRVARSLSASRLKTETAVRHGDPRSVIVDEAEDWKADLIVLGSHGYTGIKKWLLGSVAQSVVSHAPCSVEVVRSRGPREARPAA